MLGSLLKSVLSTAASFLIIGFFSTSISFSNWWNLLIAALVLTVLQSTLQPLLKLLLLPINIITLGLFSWLINAAVLWLAVMLVPGFSISALRIAGLEIPLILTLGLMSAAIGICQNLLRKLL